MRVVVNRKPLKLILRWSQYTLLTGAAFMLGYCGFVLTERWTFQHQERLRFERLLTDRQEPASITPTAQNPADGLIGRLEIARLGLNSIVIEGTRPIDLEHAAGHISNTALPGQPGNIGLAAHRDTFFRPLRNIRQNDIITLTTLSGEFRYRVVSTRIVDPYDVAVLDSNGTEVLTLVTCYPFNFVGAAPNRFIVRAERVTLSAGILKSQEHE